MAEGGNDFDKGHDEYIDGQDEYTEGHEEFIDEQDELLVDTCDRCENKDRTSVAEFYCLTCHQYLCVSCQDIHNLTTSHCAFGENDRYIWGKRWPADIDTEGCPTHPGHGLIIYCGQHEALCCDSCVLLNHSTCAKKIFILDDTSVRNISKSKELQDVKNDISTLEGCLNKIRDKKSELQSSFRLKNAQLGAVKHKAELFQSIERDVQADIDTCDSLVNDFQDLQDQLSNSKIDYKTFVSMKKAKDKLLHARGTLNALAQPIDYDVETVDEHGQCINDPQPGMSSESMTVDPENFKKYTIRADGDKNTCDIQGICMLPDGTIILSDKRNENIKSLDRNYLVVETCSMRANPRGICSVDIREVAVALGSKKKVQFVSVTDTMRITKTIKFKHSCNGIAYCTREDKRYLYITGGSILKKLYVYVLNRNSEESTLIGTYSDKSPMSVALSGDGNFVYIVGIDKTLRIQNWKGAHIKSTEHPDMKVAGEYPNVCVDMRGNVLVSLQFVGILQFRHSGTEPSGILVNDGGVTRPEVVFVDYIRQKLIVQRNEKMFGGSDTVGVWDIKYV